MEKRWQRIELEVTTQFEDDAKAEVIVFKPNKILMLEIMEPPPSHTTFNIHRKILQHTTTKSPYSTPL
jgi:hypothetical protein